MKDAVTKSIMAIILILFTLSCKESSDRSREAESEVEEIEKTGNDLLKDNENLTSEVPSFGNSAVQDYVNSYEAYLEEYSEAVENQDIEALSGLGPKGQELSIKAQEISGNMSVEDAQKFTHYMTEKAKEIRELTLKISK